MQAALLTSQPAQTPPAPPKPPFDYIHFLHRLKEWAFATFLAIIFLSSLGRILWHELNLDVVFAKTPGIEVKKPEMCPGGK